MKILIKNGLVFDEKNDFVKKDILLDDGIIIKIDNEIKENRCEIIDASESYVLPGLIDTNCRICEPGYEYNEGAKRSYLSA